MIGSMKRGPLGYAQTYGAYGAFWDFLKKQPTDPTSADSIEFTSKQPKIQATSQNFRDVPGSGGYVYRQFSDGSITILGGPQGVGTTLTAGSFWQAITAEIGPYPQSGLVSTLTGLFGGGSQTATAPAGQAAGQAAGQGLLALIPFIGQGVSTVASTIQAKRNSLAGLQARLAKKQQAFLNAAGNPVKQARLKAEIQSLLGQIAALESEIAGGNQAIVTTPMVVEPPAKLKWLPFALGGGALLLMFGGLAFALTRKKR